jgi:glycosyltransferase involved in cell wall biosynthesis
MNKSKNTNSISSSGVSSDEPVHEWKKTIWDMITEVQTAKGRTGNLELKRGDAAKLDNANLPTISIITVTKDRRKYMPIAINNFLNFIYDRQKIEWIILDDSENKENHIHDLLDPLMKAGHKIKYVLLKEVITVGRKRNLGCKLAQNEFICMMDDDDIYFSDSLLAKATSLVTYNKDILFSRPLAIYDVVHGNSYIIEGFEDVAEASLFFRKSYWENYAKFDDVRKNQEGVNLIAGNEHRAIQLPFFFNFICINHKTNLTGRLRQLRFLAGRRNMQKINRMQSIKSQRNFFKDFTKETQVIMKSVFNL